MSIFLTVIISTHANGSRMSVAIIQICVFVCLHDKTKMAETKIASPTN